MSEIQNMVIADALGRGPSASDYAAGEIGRNRRQYMRSIERVILAMRKQLEHPMDNQQLAEIACLSPYHFNRVFHRVTGIPPIQFHYALRLQRAKELLLTTNLCITDICFEVGYNSLGTFSSRFTKLIGMAPNAFRSFAKGVATVRLDQVARLLSHRQDPGENAITGNLDLPGHIGGITFVAVFRRAIPEGKPITCALTTTARYRVPLPGDGAWYVFSVAAPWSSTLAELLTMDGLPRGRSGLLTVEHDRWCGDSSIRLESPHLHHPPALLNLPMLIVQWLSTPSVRQTHTTSQTVHDAEAVSRGLLPYLMV